MNLSVNFEIIYKNGSLYRPGELLDFYNLPASQTSLDLGNLPPFSSTAGNPPTVPLIAGQNYVIGMDASLTGSEGGVGYQYSESQSFTSFMPSNIAPPFAGPIYLPNTIFASGVVTYNFDLAVALGDSYNLDPALANSFIYKIGAGDPNFASVELPDIGNLNDYSLYLWKNGQWVFDAFLGADTLFNFGPGGVSEFEIRGIDPAVDASNGAEFMTQVTFTGDGTFDGSMTAVVPESSTWAMMLVGFAGLGYAGFRRKAARSVAA
jgi:hypothetical protein